LGFQFFWYLGFGYFEKNLILGKNQEKKVSEVTLFLGYSGFAGSLVFGISFFFREP
jgi:hypothetical protein